MHMQFMFIITCVPNLGRMCSLHLNGDSVRGEGYFIAAKKGTGPPIQKFMKERFCETLCDVKKKDCEDQHGHAQH